MYPNEFDYLEKMVDLRAKGDYLASVFKEMRQPPNNRQFALATAAAILLDHHEKQMYVVKGGDGKSRIAITLAVLILLTKKEGRDKKGRVVHLIFSNDELMKKDRAYFADLVENAHLE